MRAAAALLLGLVPFAHPVVYAQSSAPPNVRYDSSFPVTLDHLRDNYRVLLVFAATDQDPAFLKQVDAFSLHPQAALERDLFFVAVNRRWENVHWRKRVGPMTHGHLGSDEAADVRRRLHIAPGSFTVVLLGKDGGEKLRSHVPLSAQRLMETIDSMPMRQQEMSERRREPKTP